MSDIRQRLNARREDLQGRIQKAEELVDGSASVGSSGWNDGSRAIGELLQIEAILAQMQTSDAQKDLAAAQREVAEAQRKATTESELARLANEGSAFWSRRFFTSVAIANGAGAFASVSAILRPDPPQVSNCAAAAILGCFLTGTFLSGALPLLLTFHPNLDLKKKPWPLAQWAAVAATALAAMLFLIGLGFVLKVGFDTLDRNQATTIKGAWTLEMRR